MTDRIAVLARFLAANLGWLVHRSEIDEFAGDVGDCAGRLRGMVNGPSEQRFLGPCGAELVEDITSIGEDGGEGIRTYRESVCEGDVYGPRGGRTGRCRTCEAEVAQVDRRAWLDGEVRAHAFRAAEIAGAYGVNVKTIRTWAARGQLLEHGRDRDDHPLFMVGDVLDLAAADAARRETNRAKRERRLTLANTQEDAA